MSRIVPDIDTLDQHLHQLEFHPEIYCPVCCPHCGIGTLWRHGDYYRKADRERRDGDRLDPVPIPRYYCPGCRHTCSRLPSGIAPRRWYLWAVQQAAIAFVLGGRSFRRSAGKCQPNRRTISRWWQRMKERFALHSFHLRNHFPALGRHASISSFWPACLEQMSLVDAMTWLDRDGVIIP